MSQPLSRSSLPGAPVTILRPASGWIALDLRELWEARELLAFLTWRDIKVKYSQALLGVAWAVLVPFGQMVVFSLIFGRLAGLPSDGLPSPVFYYAALLPWTYFATALTASSQSLVVNSSMLTKVYFPRIMMPAAACLAGLLDFLIALTILVAMMFFYRIPPASTALLIPVLMLIVFATVLGVGLLFAALNVKYRDVRHVIPFIVQVWMFCSVILPFSRLPEHLGAWRYLYGLNPMAGVIEGFRWCLLRHRMSVERIVDGEIVLMPVETPWLLILAGLPTAAGLLAFGLYYFRRVEKRFADIV
jgi:lipopolysaccharide transport system permease protein